MARSLLVLIFTVSALTSGCWQDPSISQRPESTRRTNIPVQKAPKEDPLQKRYHSGYRLARLRYKDSKQREIKRKLAVWYPSEKSSGNPAYEKLSKLPLSSAEIAPGPHPVILFSHGLWSAPEFSSFLIEELARQGYIVAGPHHKDAVTQWKNYKPKMPDFFKPKEWDLTSYVDRTEDIRAALDYLISENKNPKSPLHSRISAKAIGAMGHSMGGYTIYGLIGGWSSWREPRIRAALLLSPYALPYLVEGRNKRLQLPVMLQGATGDLGITPFLPGLYRSLSGPKYFLVLDRENHFSWTNLVCKGKPFKEAVRSGSPELIARYSSAFFHRHLKGLKTAETVLRKKDPALKDYTYKD